MRVAESFLVGEDIKALRGWERAWMLQALSLIPYPMYLFQLAIGWLELHIILYYSLYNNKLVIVKCLPEFCKPSSKVPNPRKGYRGPLIYSQLIRSMGDQGLSINVCRGGSFVDLSP